METTRKNIPVKERLKEFIASLGISEREFCRKIGVSSAYVESIKQSISPKVLQAISIHYPKLNPSWLLVGNGEMLFGEKKVEPEKGGALPSEVLAELLVETRNEKAKLITANARLTDVVASQQRTIEELTRQLKKVAAQPGDAATSAAVG